MSCYVMVLLTFGSSTSMQEKQPYYSAHTEKTALQTSVDLKHLYFRQRTVVVGVQHITSASAKQSCFVYHSISPGNIKGRSTALFLLQCLLQVLKQ